MTDRPILKFPNPTLSQRRTGSPRTPPQPSGPGRGVQSERFRATFNRLSTALEAPSPRVALSADPAGIAPERALVFVTAGGIQNFARVARDLGLEVFAESELETIEDFPEGFSPPGEGEALSRTLYATMPTIAVFEQLITLWNAYERGETPPRGAAPWWKTFDLLLELRCWSPEDRLTVSAQEAIREQLPLDDYEEMGIEIEIWPTARADQRRDWRVQTEQRVQNLGGHVVDSASISESGFIYEAILASLPAHAVRSMLDDPSGIEGLAVLEGVQLILPQTVGQAPPGDPLAGQGEHEPLAGFNFETPIRGALIDGTPVASHEALEGGMVIEDVHDIVRLSQVNQRQHGTAMASLILRGDLDTDGVPLRDTRLVGVPVLVDADTGAWTPDNRLFVDLVHTALTTLISGDEPLATEVFVVNFSIGVADMRFTGRISSLARLLDWWAVKAGLLFVISAGNIGEPLLLSGVSALEFENSGEAVQREVVRAAMKAMGYGRTLLAPSEALNGIAVGAVSEDLAANEPPRQAGVISLSDEGETVPQLTSALGLGVNRSVKPDFLQFGGRQEARVRPSGTDAMLGAIEPSQRTGLIVASPRGEGRATQKMRGTSPAAALTTRAILQAAEALAEEGGPYEGLELPRKTLSLLTRALAVNAARWPEEALALYTEEYQFLGRGQHGRAKEEVCRHFGYGSLVPELMQRSPDSGVTIVGYGSIRKDQAQVFKLPLPASMSGDRIPRSMRVTIAWFSPINPARAQYRLASLEAVAADGVEDAELARWGLNLKADGPDANLIKRGSVWSKRLIHSTQTAPEFDEGSEIPICVQCRDASSGGLSQDEDIEFAIAVTLEVEADVRYDIHSEVEQQLRLRLQRGV